MNSSWEHSATFSHGEAVNEMVIECGRSGNALGFELMAVASAIQIFIYMLFSVVISWPLMAIAAGFGVLTYLIVRPFNIRAKQLGEMTSKANRDLSFYCLEYLRILKIAKATATIHFAQDEISNKNQSFFDVSFNSQMNSTQVHFIVQALPVLLLTGILGISYQIIQVPVPVILVFLLFMMRVAPRIGTLQHQVQTYNQRCHALGIVNEAIENSDKAAEILNPEGKKFDRIENQISLENVSFSFPDGETPAIDDVSMTFGRNELVAIVGASGAGKSTLMDILTGIRIPRHGRVSIDDTNLMAFDLKSWRRRIGIVTQDIAILNTSLRNNLKFFNPEATDEEIEEALTTVHLKEIVEDLSEGLDTILGEGGVRFSGGQKQRIALARALLRSPELLLLDEATSALDNESERDVQKALHEVAKKMTIVIIAHRLSTVRQANKIYVLDKGRLMESGTYDDLMEHDGLFAKLRNIEIN